MEETWTILKVLQWTTGYFQRKGIEQPRANAEVLLSHLLGMERLQLYLHHDKPLSADELASYREAVRRRASREPLQYITGKQEFWSLEFEVAPSVLIPRPETEILVERAIQLLRNSPQATVLDLGTGSGAIAVCIAKECPSVRVVATDKSLPALQAARRNAVRHGVQDRVHFAAMDLFGGFFPSSRRFDLVATNPPYIGDAEFPSLQPEVAQYEPESALRGEGPHGLEIIRRILRDAPAHIKAGGELLMEIGQGQAEILENELTIDPRVEAFEFIRDYSGILRVLHLSKLVG